MRCQSSFTASPVLQKCFSFPRRYDKRKSWNNIQKKGKQVSRVGKFLHVVIFFPFYERKNSQKREKFSERGNFHSRERKTWHDCMRVSRAEHNSNPFSGCCWANFSSLLSLLLTAGFDSNFVGIKKNFSFFLCRCYCRIVGEKVQYFVVVCAAALSSVYFFMGDIWRKELLSLSRCELNESFFFLSRLRVFKRFRTP